VVWVDYNDAMRFCNWLHNGQPAGAQDNSTTEDGAYTLTPEAIIANSIVRNPGARFWLPSDDEWYKAAYHQPFEADGDPSDYWLYPTRSNDNADFELPPGGFNSVNACCDNAATGDRCWRVHTFLKLLRNFRPGRQRAGMDRGDCLYHEPPIAWWVLGV